MHIPASARHTDPVTSHEAAKRLSRGVLLQRIVETIRSFGENGCIHEDVVNRMSDIPPTSISPAYAVLERKGVIRFTDEKRRSSFNRNQRVIQATPKE